MSDPDTTDDSNDNSVATITLNRSEATNVMDHKWVYQDYIEAAKIPAEKCLHYGVMKNDVAADELVSATQARAGKLAQGAPLAQNYGTQILCSLQPFLSGTGNRLESKKHMSCSTSQDSQSAIKAFFDKKTPSFIGK